MENENPASPFPFSLTRHKTVAGCVWDYMPYLTSPVLRFAHRIIDATSLRRTLL